MTTADWIPVGEQQPKVTTPVLGFDEYYKRVGEAYYTGRTDDFGEPRFVFIDSDDCRITHWMPMPEAPKYGARKPTEEPTEPNRA